ncbi:hypothetical protein [Cellulomonas sp. P5_C5]
MELVPQAVFGGPDHARLFPPGWMRALKDAVVGVEMPGVDTVDVAFRIGGHILSFEGDAGVHHVRFSAVRQRVTANVVVPDSELAELGTAALVPHLDELSRAVAQRVAPDRVDELAGALARAFREALPSPAP